MRMVPRALACALVVISCGGDELLLPAEGEPATIAIVGGDGQTGPIGGQLADPLVVRVSDTRGRPVAGLAVAFAPEAGSVQPETATTDADGLAATQWSLGMQTGPQQVNASVPAASPPLAVRFAATASAGAARGLIIVSGNGQSAPAGSSLAAPLVVRLLDGSGNPIAGGEVSWVIGQGGGSVDPATGTTAADGTTSATWTLGPALGTNTLTAVVTGVGRVEFTATGTAGAAVRLLLNGGNNQSAPVQSPLPAPLSVKAVDANGNGVGGVAVAWAVTAGGGSLSASTTTTRADGTAEVNWTLGSAAGDQTAQATAGSLDGSPVTFTATATSSSPPPPPTPDPSRSSLSANPTSFVAGNGSSNITVTVRDAQGAPLSGVAVQLTVSGSGNSISQPGATNSSGIATGSFTSGVAEAKTVSATAGGVSIQQTATVTVTAAPPPPPPSPDPSRSSLSADPTSFEAGSASGSTITITVRDAQGTPLSGVAVQISVSGSGNAVTQPGSTNANGVATGAFTSTVAELKTVSATAEGVAIQQTATVTVTAPPPPPPSSDASQTTADVPNGVAGSATPISVQVRDASGAPVTRGGDDVAVAVSGSNNVGDLVVADNGDGTYRTSYIPEVAGVDRVDITLDGTPIGGSPYSSTVVAASASQIGFLTQAGNERVGRVFRPPIEVAVQDRFENLVTSSSAPVTIALGQGSTGTPLLEGTLTRSSVGGVATFDDLIIQEAGDYTLRATSPGLEAGESQAFGVRD